MGRYESGSFVGRAIVGDNYYFETPEEGLPPEGIELLNDGCSTVEERDDNRSLDDQTARRLKVST
ncbi:MAG: hypothetical protein ACRD0Z_08225 [Acidimicrobiales bacterium]